MIRQAFQLDKPRLERHSIHTGDRLWVETNCYVDVWVELLHAWGFDPVAGLPFSIAIDFEGDQWTFFKYPLADLHSLYGLDVKEYAVWRPLVDHLEEQISLGRPVLVELDSFYLPDTAGTAYREAHVKSTIAAMEIDVTARRLNYFHNQGYHELEGDDFTSALRVGEPCNSPILPPYVEIVKRHDALAASGTELVARSLGLLRQHLALAPAANPFRAFKSRFEADLAWLMNGDLNLFHQYSFATLRQFGACFELAATYIDWLRSHGVSGLDRAHTGCMAITTGAKSLQFQLARSMARRKPLDISSIDGMAEHWTESLATLRAAVL